jgi:hypothetical protein
MNQPPGSSVSFLPFDPLPGSSGQSPGGEFRLKVLQKTGQSAGPAGSVANVHSLAGSGHAAVPGVTLQRDGDKVTGIRVECVCGMIIELACVY